MAVEQIQPPGLVGTTLTTSGLKRIDPNARAALGGFGSEPGLEDAGGAKKIDLGARAKLGGFKNPIDEFDLAPPEADPINEFDRVDDLDARTVPELNKDRGNFDPVSYLSTNPDVADDPVRSKKLLDVYRMRREEGLTAGGVVAAIKKTPEVLADVGGGIKRVGEAAIDLIIQPQANVVLSAFTGDLFDDKKRKALFAETGKTMKKAVGEVSAAEESTSFGVVDLSRQGLRKLEPASQAPIVGSEFETPAIPEKRASTDQQLLAEIHDDVEFRRTAEMIGKGEGEVAKNLGLDKETLAKQGITLDEDAIRQLSLVDPLSIVLAGGAYKLVSISGKVVGTANTIAGVEKLAAGLGKMAKYSTSKLAKGTGRVATDIGKSAESRTFGAFGLSSPLITGDITTLASAAGAKYIAGPIARKTGAALTQVGKEIAGDLPASAGMTRLMKIASGATDAGVALGEGAAKGALASAPFAVMADEDETAGALLGVGTALGTGAGAAARGGKAFRVVKTAAAREYFGPNRKPIPAVDSPGYGRVPELDAMQVEQRKKLSTATANELDNFREGLRNRGQEIYAVDRATFRQKAADRYKAQTGKDIDPALLDKYEKHHALFDETNPDGTKVVYLNADAGGAAALQHDAGHLFDSLLSPEKVTELNAAIDKAFTPEQQKAFKDKYQKDVGNKISDEDAKSEFRAEQFGAMFHNTPVSELAAPKSLLKLFADVVARAAEVMGVDIVGGATTPNLGAPQTVGLRNMFESAARTVLKEGKEAPKPAVPPVIESGAPAPAPEPSARNIRGITPEQTAPLAESPPAPVATPAVRAAAAERSKVTGITEARDLAKKSINPEIYKAVEDISTSMESGNPVVRVEHLGITSPGGPPGAPEGAVARKATREAGYEKLAAAQIEFRENAPADIVSLHEKTFKPLRWDGTTLIAVSTDKLMANAIRIAKDPKTAGTHPYEVKDNKFTDAGWKEVLADAQTFSDNQMAGRKGNGERLELPKEELGLSIPAENPNYTPKFLSDARANFQNAIQGVETPKTARETKGQVAGNLKGQLVREANKLGAEIPANIPAKYAGKQAFVSVPGRVVREVNPFRNELERRGFNTRNLDSAVERIRAQDIVKTEPRPDIKFAGMVTDISRAGFSPAPTEFRQKSLQGKTVQEFAQYVLDSPVEEWIAATKNMQGGQTGGSINLGLGLKDRGDLAILKRYQEEASAKAISIMDKIKAMGVANAPESLFTESQIASTKAMFFREALESAQGTGSMGSVFKRGAMGTEGVKIPFPVEEPPTKSN